MDKQYLDGILFTMMSAAQSRGALHKLWSVPHHPSIEMNRVFSTIAGSLFRCFFRASI